MTATSNRLTVSREKNADGALLLLGLALAAGDDRRAMLARSILAECGHPGGEGAPSVNDAVAAMTQDEHDDI